MSILTKKMIDEFFAVKRLAIIGVSRDKKEYSRLLYADLQKRGYEVVPVNPNQESVEGKKCYASVKDIKPPVDRVILLLPPEKTEQAVLDCVAAGIKTIWLHQHIAKGITNTRAIYVCEAKGIDLITGFCPFMFMPQTGAFHKFHGAILKLIGAYPK